MIIIHFDYTDGTEISYGEGKILKDNFATCVLNFFCWDYIGKFVYNEITNEFDFETITDDVVILKANGDYISLRSIYNHTDRFIRFSHNVSKMLTAQSFIWLPNFNENYVKLSKPHWISWDD